MGARPLVYPQKASLCVISFVLTFARQAAASCPRLPLHAHSTARPPRGTVVTVVITGIVRAALHLLLRQLGGLSLSPRRGGISASSSDQGSGLAEGVRRCPARWHRVV